MSRSLLRGLLALTLVFAPLAVTGCGDDDDNGNDNTNDTPADHLSEDFLSAPSGTPDYSCVGSPDPALTYTTETEISGVVEDFEEEWAVEGIIVNSYASLDDLLNDQPYDSSDPSGPTGEYTVLVPANVARIHFKMVPDSGSDYYDTIELNEPVAGMPPGPPQDSGKDRIAVSAVTMESVPAILGINRLEGTGIVAGKVYDCNRAEMEYAAQRAYDAPPDDPDRTLLSVYEGADRNSFYFGNGMPVRNRMFTDENGQFIIANLPVSPGAFLTMEMWGRLQSDWLPAGHEDCTEGCLISIQDIPILADTIVVTDMLPLYSE
jgi:hypothetical protein